jgi:hypothetical protein
MIDDKAAQYSAIVLGESQIPHSARNIQVDSNELKETSVTLLATPSG